MRIDEQCSCGGAVRVSGDNTMVVAEQIKAWRMMHQHDEPIQNTNTIIGFRLPDEEELTDDIKVRGL